MRRRPKLYFHTITVFFLGVTAVVHCICGQSKLRWADSSQLSGLTPSRVSVPSSPNPKSPKAQGLIAEGDLTMAQPPVRFIGKPGFRAVRGRLGMVVSVEDQATRAGVEILESGGNAVDAAVAVALTLAVTHPSAGNIGGGGFWLIHRQTEPTIALDFRETAPAALERHRFDAMIRAGGEGNDSVGVPGTIAGLFEAHKRYGKLPWSRVTIDAIRLAQKGHHVGPREAIALRQAWPTLSKSPAARGLFALQNGLPPSVGAWVKRPTLGRTLERIRDQGSDGFYRGEVAESVVKSLGTESQLSLQDLTEYRPRWRNPRRMTYRGLIVETMPLPSAGGVALSEGLALLERFDVGKMQYGSAGHLHLLLEIQRRADHDRVLIATDPDQIGIEQLLRFETRVRDPHAWDEYPIDPMRATPSLQELATNKLHESPDTTHFSVVDADRTVVSATMTLSAAFGSKLVTETGIPLNNTLASFAQAGANQPHPRQRTTSSMAPTLVFDDTGPVLVLGTPGGDTIASTLLEVLSNIVDFGMSLDTAVDAPRVHQSFTPDRARFEGSRPIGITVRRELMKMGHIVTGKAGKQGHANCILLINSEVFGYADPREGGLALAPMTANGSHISGSMP